MRKRGTDINDDWRIDDAVKPRNMSALTRSVPYDYIITREMLEGLSGEVDVSSLLGSPVFDPPGEYHILINGIVPETAILVFPGRGSGEGSDPREFHIHSFSSYNAKVDGDTDWYTYCFHTNGTTNAVTLYGVGMHTCVGSFRLGDAITIGAGMSFEYEAALADVPEKTSTGRVDRVMWMSSSIVPNNGRLRIKTRHELIGTFYADQAENVDAVMETVAIGIPSEGYHDDIFYKVSTGKGIAERWEIDETDHKITSAEQTLSINPAPTASNEGQMFSVNSNGETCWSDVPEEVYYVNTGTAPDIQGVMAALNAHKIVFTNVVYNNMPYLLMLQRVDRDAQNLPVLVFSNIISVDEEGVTELICGLPESGNPNTYTERHTHHTQLKVKSWQNVNLPADVPDYDIYIYPDNNYNIRVNRSTGLHLKQAMPGAKPAENHATHCLLAITFPSTISTCIDVTLYWTDEGGIVHKALIRGEETVSLSPQEYVHMFDVTVQAIAERPGTYSHYARVFDLPCAYRSREDLYTGDASTSNAQIALHEGTVS